MKRILFLIALCLPFQMNAQTTTSLSQQLDSLLSDDMFRTSSVAMMVWDLTDDQPLYRYNHQQLLRPASTMKLMTAITACDLLGDAYQLDTRFYHTGTVEGKTLRGDIYCVGGMDPMFDGDDLEAVVSSLRQLGVDTLQGNIFADVSMKDTTHWGEGWCWDDKNPSLSPLQVKRSDQFLDYLVDQLIMDSVAFVNVGIGRWNCPVDATLFCVRSHSINDVMKKMMKDSDNLYAEAMFYQIAARSTEGKAYAEDAKKAERELIRKAGLKPGDYRLADGSGLSLYNYLSAEAEVMILRYAWQNRRIYDQLLPTLPVAGKDGTLKKRMKKTTAEGNVQAKTGTVTGVSALAGYCTATNDHRLCFSIINQGIMNSTAGRDFQDRVCVLLTGGSQKAKPKPKRPAPKRRKR